MAPDWRGVVDVMGRRVSYGGSAWHGAKGYSDIRVSLSRLLILPSKSHLKFHRIPPTSSPGIRGQCLSICFLPKPPYSDDVQETEAPVQVAMKDPPPEGSRLRSQGPLVSPPSGVLMPVPSMAVVSPTLSQASGL